MYIFLDQQYGLDWFWVGFEFKNVVPGPATYIDLGT